MQNLNISVIICCHNSSPRLSAALAHLARQILPNDIVWEIVVVDNASTDDTATIAKTAWAEFGSPVELRLIHVQQIGLAEARKAGIMGTSGQIIIFCDDDNWLKEDYLSIVYSIFDRNMRVGAIGGQSNAAFELGTAPPNWFSINAEKYAIGKQSLQTGNVTSRGFVWGAGIAIRAEPLRQILRSGVRYLLSGRKGHQILSGEDSEMCAWLIIAGYELYYDERLIFAHFIPENRLTISYLNGLNKGFQASDKVLSAYRAFINLTILSAHKGARTTKYFVSIAKNCAKIFIQGTKVARNINLIRKVFSKPSK